MLRERDVMFNLTISPYIREGSGLKHIPVFNARKGQFISPYIREGSGLKLHIHKSYAADASSPLTSVRGAD